MTDRKAYQLLLLEIECVKNRPTCGGQCRTCPFFKDKVLELHDALRYVVEILKARCPELYFDQKIQTFTDTILNDTKEEQE